MSGDPASYDYIVVGAGSAGCVVAARLSEDPGARVLLLEAGASDRNLFIHIPAGVGHLIAHPVLNWNHLADPDPGIDGRRMAVPRGKVLGGSSSINGMLYVRGNPADYDGWAQMGCRGWSYDEVLPYFRKSERHAGGDPAFRGTDGPIVVEEARTVLPLTHHFVEAAQQAGYPFTRDYNGKTQEGVSYVQATRHGRFRQSTAATFLAQARHRPNLAVETEALATALVIEAGRCTGVRFRQHGIERTAAAAREVIVSSGAIKSPHLLQLSGIGAPERLAAAGIAVTHALPGVGANLSDHLIVRITHRVKGARTVNEMRKGLRLIPELFRYVFAASGALTFGATTANVFTRSREGLASPDLQFLFAPLSFLNGLFGQPDDDPGMNCAVCRVRPDSRGTVLAASPDPTRDPAIQHNYLSAPADITAMLSGIEQTRRIFAQPALARYSTGEAAPGPDVTGAPELTAFIRATGSTVFHPVGTCKMGEDPMAVVDARLRVHGLRGLRVADASIMPTVTTGNTNAPSIMIGEKCAAMIKEDVRAM